MYCLFFKPDEEVMEVADQDEDEDLLTDDDKGNDANGDMKMRDANPSLNPQGGDKESSFANPQPSTPQSGKSHRQASMIQEALDTVCEQLFDEISIKVMLEKDSVGWKTYSPLTDEERRLYSARVELRFSATRRLTPFRWTGVLHLHTLPLSSIQDVGTLVVAAPLFATGDPAVVSAPLHAGEGVTDATGEMTAAVSGEVLSHDASAVGEDSLSNARTEEVAVDDAVATFEGAPHLLWGSH
jgi:hypothetical protein